MISNLLSNAIRHGANKNKIHIALKDKTLTISNSGTQSLKTESLFKRFISASAQSPGTGLGLAIVKEISDKYGWTISYSFKENLHFFSIKF
jgi:signal transduction histidine kinase